MTSQQHVYPFHQPLHPAIGRLALLCLLLLSGLGLRAQCNPDVTPPVCPTANITVSCENFDPSLLAYGEPTDDCCMQSIVKTASYASFNTVCNYGSITRTFLATDCSANSASCTQNITVIYTQSYFVKFPNDVTVVAGTPIGLFGQPTFYGVDCESMASSYHDQVIWLPAEQKTQILRTWSIINSCVYDPAGAVTEVPNPNPDATPGSLANLIGPTVSANGTPAPWSPTVVKLTPTDPAPTNFSTYYSQSNNGYSYIQHIEVLSAAWVQGDVYADTSDNCAREAGEAPLANWHVKGTSAVTGYIAEAQTDNSGHYLLVFPTADTLAYIEIVTPVNYGQNCQSVYTISPNPPGTVFAIQDIPVHLEGNCPLLSVGLSTPQVRRCLENRYTAQVCNLSTQSVSNVSVNVQLDPYFNFTTSSIPGINTGPNTYAFPIGTLVPGACTNFIIDFILNCEAPLGATHCSTADVLPNDLCSTDSLWSGGDVQLSGACDGDSVRLHITNIGTGGMVQALDFVVVEDVIMYQNGTFQLTPGNTKDITVPANGATWRLQTEEEPNHPWGGMPAIAIEGCGGINIPGLVTVFALNSDNPFTTTDCQENIGSFDPNDKQVFPKGVGANHLVEANTPLEYLIRFQNTGTDTAFTIVVLDTLSQYLDVASLRPLVASHPYAMTVLDDHILQFRFDNILLPDSSTNQLGSNGFVKFRISQQPNLANGTRIENQAAIYFDYNEPVLTNTTFNTIGDHFIVVDVNPEPANAALLRIFPNPAAEVVNFELPASVGTASFVLTNQTGQIIRQANWNGRQYRFERQGVASGLYFFKINTTAGQTFSGKIILK